MIFFIIIKKKSERIQNKNFKLIRKKQLWRHLLDKLTQYKVFIDTDSEKIVKYCKKYYPNVYAYKRDKKFIEFEDKKNNKISPVLMMIKNFLKNYILDDNQVVVTTHVTSPFLELKTIRKASKYLNKYEFVHSVTEHHEFAWIKKNKKLMKINFDKKVKKTQNLDPIIFSNGAFFIFKKKNFMKYNNRLGNKNFFYKLDYPESIEIDNYSDLKLARMI